MFFFKHLVICSQNAMLFLLKMTKVSICIQSKLSKESESEAVVAFNCSASLVF